MITGLRGSFPADNVLSMNNRARREKEKGRRARAAGHPGAADDEAHRRQGQAAEEAARDGDAAGSAQEVRARAWLGSSAAFCAATGEWVTAGPRAYPASSAEGAAILQVSQRSPRSSNSPLSIFRSTYSTARTMHRPSSLVQEAAAARREGAAWLEGVDPPEAAAVTEMPAAASSEHW